MNEKVLEALTDASMVSKDDGDKLAVDLVKIRILLDSTAKISISQQKNCKCGQIKRFVYSVGANSNDGIQPLREDEVCAKSADNIAEQSKYHEKPYNVVPRVV